MFASLRLSLRAHIAVCCTHACDTWGECAHIALAVVTFLLFFLFRASFCASVRVTLTLCCVHYMHSVFRMHDAFSLCASAPSACALCSDSQSNGYLTNIPRQHAFTLIFVNFSFSTISHFLAVRSYPDVSEKRVDV
jgi:hypothetical protein